MTAGSTSDGRTITFDLEGAQFGADKPCGQDYIPEAITSEVEGLLVPPGDASALAEALRRVLTDATLRDRLAETAKQRADRDFTLTAMTDRYEALYYATSAEAKRIVQRGAGGDR